MTLETAAIYIALVLALSWATYQHLTVRELRHSRVRQRRQLNKHARALIQLQGIFPYLPTSNGQPMNGKVWSGSMAPLAPGGVVTGQAWDREDGPELVVPLPQPDIETVPLPELPAVKPTLEQVLAGASRGLTPTELADRMDCMVWDLIAPIDQLVLDGKIEAVAGHTAGRISYRLTNPTERLPRGMSVLPGANR